MSRRALEYAQSLLRPKPEKPNHDVAHDEACVWADAGFERESP